MDQERSLIQPEKSVLLGRFVRIWGGGQNFMRFCRLCAMLLIDS
jgi:hypothetical protein